MKSGIFKILVLATLLTFVYSSMVYASTTKKYPCAAKGCSNYAAGDGNYCTQHTCRISGCKNSVKDGQKECSGHKCYVAGCNRYIHYTKGEKKGLCYYHGMEEHSSEIKNKEKKSYSTYHKRNSNNPVIARSNKSKYGTTTYSKNKSSGKDKYEMPDCDDYESYDDFMDDWDGNMPDGSDAEDYWEDW